MCVETKQKQSICHWQYGARRLEDDFAVEKLNYKIFFMAMLPRLCTLCLS